MLDFNALMNTDDSLVFHFLHRQVGRNCLLSIVYIRFRRSQTLVRLAFLTPTLSPHQPCFGFLARVEREDQLSDKATSRQGGSRDPAPFPGIGNDRDPHRHAIPTFQTKWRSLRVASSLSAKKARPQKSSPGLYCLRGGGSWVPRASCLLLSKVRVGGQPGPCPNSEPRAACSAIDWRHAHSVET